MDHNFFFQAEDGIRDKLVTGVQTCALPICVDVVLKYDREFELSFRIDERFDRRGQAALERDLDPASPRIPILQAAAYPHPWRSEERRVGKEGRSRWSPHH